jgi:hypothetical protein
MKMHAMGCPWLSLTLPWLLLGLDTVGGKAVHVSNLLKCFFSIHQSFVLVDLAHASTVKIYIDLPRVQELDRAPLILEWRLP